MLSALPWLQRFLLKRINTLFMVGVVGLITDNEGRVILFHHTYRNRYAWGLPGGWMNRHEQPDAALVREVREESGLRIDVSGPYRIFSESAAPMVELVLRARLIEGDFTPSAEVDRMRAVSLNDIPDQVKPSQRKVIEEFLNERK